MKRKQRGITLLELLTVVAIIGLLMSIAIPNYRQYVIRASRADAKTALQQTAQRLERCYTNSTPYAYDSATCTATVTLPFTVDGGKYIVSATARNAQDYTIIATPQGGQADDAQCNVFQLTQTGAQTVTGSYSATPEVCWRR